MKITSSYYQPTLEQQAELKAHAAIIRGRIRAFRTMRDIKLGFDHMNVGAQQATRAAAAASFPLLGLPSKVAGA